MIKELTDKNYNQIVNDTDSFIFVLFKAPMCSPCMEAEDILELLDIYFSKKDIVFYKCDISKNHKIAKKYEIDYVPFTILIDKEKKIRIPNNGLSNIDNYIKSIESVISTKKSIFHKIFRREK